MVDALLRAVGIPAAIVSVLLAGFAVQVEQPIAAALGITSKTASAVGGFLANRLIEHLFWRQIGGRLIRAVCC